MVFSVQDICEVFFSIEEKYNLNYQEIQGCYPWLLTRFFLYVNISSKIDTFGLPQQNNLSLLDKFKTFVPFCINSIFSNPLIGKYTKDFLIFDHPRKTFFKNQYRDIYSCFLVDFLKDYSYEVIEAPYFNKHFSKKEKHVKYSDRILLGSYVHKKVSKINFTNSEKELIRNIKKDLDDAFDLDINLEEIFKNHILNFQYEYKKYIKLFSKRKPKKIFVVVAYQNFPIVAAAKDLGIEVLELQHGLIGSYHLGYSYPNSRLNGEIPYFPDKILTFSEYWLSNDCYPISSENIIPVGFPYFDYQSKNFRNIEKKENQILFISQGTIGKLLSELAYQVALELKDYKIIYKLHPGEYETWKQNYSNLVKASNLDNVEIIGNNNVPLYKLFAESTYQVGAFSTAIFEGLTFNCKTFLMDLPGIEHVKDLIDENYAFKIKDASDLINNLETFNPQVYPENFFFKSFDKQLLKKVIFNEE